LLDGSEEDVVEKQEAARALPRIFDIKHAWDDDTTFLTATRPRTFKTPSPIDMLNPIPAAGILRIAPQEARNTIFTLFFSGGI